MGEIDKSATFTSRVAVKSVLGSWGNTVVGGGVRRARIASYTKYCPFFCVSGPKGVAVRNECQTHKRKIRQQSFNLLQVTSKSEILVGDCGGGGNVSGTTKGNGTIFFYFPGGSGGSRLRVFF